MIESPKEFNACGYAKECNHQVKYDMNARDNCYYQQGKEDAEREFQNSDEWNDYLAEIKKQIRADREKEVLNYLVDNGYIRYGFGVDYLAEQLKSDSSHYKENAMVEVVGYDELTGYPICKGEPEGTTYEQGRADERAEIIGRVQMTIYEVAKKLDDCANSRCDGGKCKYFDISQDYSTDKDSLNGCRRMMCIDMGEECRHIAESMGD